MPDTPPSLPEALREEAEETFTELTERLPAELLDAHRAPSAH